MVQSLRPAGPSLRSQWLGQRIKQLRVEHQVPMAEIAEFLDMAQSTMSRIENALSAIKRGDLKELLTFYNADEETREQLLYLRDIAWRRDWWDGSTDGGQVSSFADYAWLESRALTIRAYGILVISGLFQTAEYAEAVIRDSAIQGESAHRIDEWVSLRLRRQEILTKSDPPTLDVVLDESALRRRFGGPKVMRAQLENLVRLAALDHVTIRVLPFTHTLHSGYEGTFSYFTLEEPYPDVAYSESAVSQMFVETPKKLDHLERVFTLLSGSALPSDESVRFISAIAKEL
ncbi:helix-turn-helix domain-containing protein [Actinorhabdospora filicis]|nr:helix-turn-helix transcriptional regulator [Actinorhabdospora filicis]